jgi:hypothetical protein
MGPGRLAPSLRDNRAECKLIVAAAEPAGGNALKIELIRFTSQGLD